MVAIMNMFNNLMKLFPHNNNGNMQPHVITYLKHVHLHQLQNLQNPQLNLNIDLVTTNLKMEWI